MVLPVLLPTRTPSLPKPPRPRPTRPLRLPQPHAEGGLMARLSRPLKTAFWEDDKVCRLSRDARLTLAGLITKMADDEGRFVATPGAVSGALFPHDNIASTRMKRWLAEIEAEGMVSIYRV